MEQRLGILSLFGLLLVMPVQSQIAPTANIDELKWKNRILLVFNADRNVTAFEHLKDQVNRSREEFDHRDMLLLEVSDDTTGGVVPRATRRGWAQKLRDRFAVGDDEFQVLLIGKDGGVKLRREKAPDLTEVFALIDTMPMRRHEMKRKPPR